MKVRNYVAKHNHNKCARHKNVKQYSRKRKHAGRDV